MHILLIQGEAPRKYTRFRRFEGCAKLYPFRRGFAVRLYVSAQYASLRTYGWCEIPNVDRLAVSFD